MIVAFDLDKIFVDYPPLVPANLINWLYRHSWKDIFSSQESVRELLQNGYSGDASYHVPQNSLEIFFRKLTHILPIRPRIRANIEYVKGISAKHQLYLITGRYGFLEKITHKLLDSYQLTPLFSHIYINSSNLQPHLFKEEILKKSKANLYIDDDLRLLKHLKNTCPGVKLFWYSLNEENEPPGDITMIRSLKQLDPYLQ